eukprot:2531006-Rhodomonas_salina.1
MSVSVCQCVCVCVCLEARAVPQAQPSRRPPCPSSPSCRRRPPSLSAPPGTCTAASRQPPASARVHRESKG